MKMKMKKKTMVGLWIQKEYNYLNNRLNGVFKVHVNVTSGIL